MSKKKWLSSNDESTKEPVQEFKTLVAKKDFSIHHNDFHLEIKAGDDLSKVPSIYLENLKTENVI